MHNKLKQTESNQPSVFDVLAEESFAQTLKPAFRYFTKFLSLRFPSKFSRVSNWFDEIYLLFDVGLQNYYLKYYGASFSENFYGFKRVLLSSNLLPRSGISKFRSLFFLAVFPYLRRKLQLYYDRITFFLSNRPRSQDEPLRIWLARILLPVFSTLKLLISVWSFILQFMYITSRSAVHSPFLLFSGVRLEKLSQTDIVMFGRSSPHPRNWFLRTLFFLPSFFSRLFGYFLFFVQFLDVFYNTDLGSQLHASVNKVSSRIPPAPQLLQESFVLGLETNKCPLCLKERRNDTVLSVSGYIFCYDCIRQYVLREKKCPVTSLPASLSHLIKIFPMIS